MKTNDGTAVAVNGTERKKHFAGEMLKFIGEMLKCS